MNGKSLFQLLCLVAALSVFPSAAKADTLRCESIGGKYQTCPVDTRGGVSLSRQLSSQGCWQNDTWGYDRNRIWVDRGCRAEFWVGNRDSGSSSGRKVAGAVVIGLVAAAIIADKNNDRNSSRSDADGYDSRYDNYGGNPRSTVQCESTGNRFVYCRLPERGHVEVYKQLSSSSCAYGSSWGVDGGRVWVSDGCRAIFAVY